MIQPFELDMYSESPVIINREYVPSFFENVKPKLSTVAKHVQQHIHSLI